MQTPPPIDTNGSGMVHVPGNATPAEGNVTGNAGGGAAGAPLGGAIPGGSQPP